MSELEYVFIKGFRKSSQLLLVRDENQLYKYKYERNFSKYYVCYNTNCPVNVAVDLNNKAKCRKTNQLIHNHGDQEQLIKKLELLNEIKHNCESISLKRNSIRDVFDSTCKRFKGNNASVEFGKIRRNLYKIKSKIFPKSPSSFGGIIELFADVNVLKGFGISRFDETKHFYRNTVIEKNFAYTIFMSENIVELISNLPESQSRNYMIDGTFSIAPNGTVFEQVLIIHYGYADYVFPFIYILMSNKSEAAYTDALKFIKTNLFDLKPDTVQTDFDTALRKAIKNVYLQAKIEPCWFHFTQAVRRKASQIPGFIKFLNKKVSAKRHFRKYLYLPLLKPSDLITAFNMLKDSSAIFVTDKDFESPFKRFNLYFEKQWINQITPQALSVTKMSRGTTSALEGFNSRLSSKLAKNGSFFKFLDILLDEDLQKTIDLQKLIDGNVSLNEPRKKSITDRDKLIRETVDQLERGILTLFDVLNRFTHGNLSEFNNSFYIDDDRALVDNEEDSDDLSNCNTQASNSNQTSTLSCEICWLDLKSNLLLPCKHFKLCSDCFEKIKTNHEKRNVLVLCTFCKQIGCHELRPYELTP